MTALIAEKMYGTPAELLAGEKVQTVFKPDLNAYWRAHAVMILVASVVVGFALVYGGNPAPWVGPIAVALAVGARAAYLKSEVMADEWRLTNLRLLASNGRIAPLSSLTARAFMGAVVLSLAGGDKYLIKYQADAAATVARIEQVKAGRK